MQLQRQLEMGYTPQEFARVLKGNFSNARSEYHCHEVADQHWHISSKKSDLKVDLVIAELPDRKLGMFALPVLQARFNVSASDTSAIDAFFEKFARYFHKGGG